MATRSIYVAYNSKKHNNLQPTNCTNMHFLKGFGALIALSILSAHTAAAPAPATAANESSVVGALELRSEQRDRVAIITAYSGDACNGEATQHAVSGHGIKQCYVIEGNSIQVSARYVHPSMLDRLHRLSLDALAVCFFLMFFQDWG